MFVQGKKNALRYVESGDDSILLCDDSTTERSAGRHYRVGRDIAWTDVLFKRVLYVLGNQSVSCNTKTFQANADLRISRINAD